MHVRTGFVQMSAGICDIDRGKCDLFLVNFYLWQVPNDYNLAGICYKYAKFYNIWKFIFVVKFNKLSQKRPNFRILKKKKWQKSRNFILYFL